MMEHATTLMRQIDGAKLVKHNEYNDIVHVWHGGHGIHVYDRTGEEIHFYNVGDFAKDEADREEVRTAMVENIDDAIPAEE